MLQIARYLRIKSSFVHLAAAPSYCQDPRLPPRRSLSLFSFPWRSDTADSTVPTAQYTDLLESSFKELGLGNFGPFGFLENVMESLHAHSGLPWWVVIISTAAIVRLATVPVFIKDRRLTMGTLQENVKMQKTQEQLRGALEIGDPRMIYIHLIEMVNYNRKIISMRSSYIFVTSSAFLCMSIAVGSLALYPVPSLVFEGPSLFPNLTVTDPTHFTALWISLTMGYNTWWSGKYMEHGSRVKYILPIVTGMACAFGSMWLPSALSLYWVSNSTMTIFLNAALQIRWLAQILKISTSDQPGFLAMYSIIIENTRLTRKVNAFIQLEEKRLTNARYEYKKSIGKLM